MVSQTSKRKELEQTEKEKGTVQKPKQYTLDIVKGEIPHSNAPESGFRSTYKNTHVHEVFFLLFNRIPNVHFA